MAPGSILLSPTRHTYSKAPSTTTAGPRPTWRSQNLRLWSSAQDARRVLIVDDDRSLLSLLAVIFRSAGFEVATATDGASALEAVKGSRPDAIVLDLEMPGMNGRQFYRELRASNDEVPVLILSAYNARAAQLELGAQAYTSKPFDPDQLVQSVEALIEAPPVARR